MFHENEKRMNGGCVSIEGCALALTSSLADNAITISSPTAKIEREQAGRSRWIATIRDEKRCAQKIPERTGRRGEEEENNNDRAHFFPILDRKSVV